MAIRRTCSWALSRSALPPFKNPVDSYLQTRAFHETSEKVDIFDRMYKRRQRDRAAWLMGTEDPLLDVVTENLLDRLEDCKRTFPTALNMGGAVMHVKKLLKGRGGVQKLTTMDMSHDMIKRSMELVPSSSKLENYYVVGDEEFLPFKKGSLDLIISALGMHWVNDLPSAMMQCQVALKPDGMFLAAMFGGETLRELRIACTVAQLEREGGISARISPLVQVQDAGNLLTAAGFALPTVDTDKYIMRYPSALELIEHLRSMGECNAISQRVKSLRKETALAAAAAYDAIAAKAGYSKACVLVGAIGKSQEIHAEIKRQGLSEMNIIDGSALVNMYAKAGLVVFAREVFDRLLECNVIAWNALMSGNLEHQYDEEITACFLQMKHESISADHVTFVCSLGACGQLGDTDLGKDIHAEIERRGFLGKYHVLGSNLVDFYSGCQLLAIAQQVFDKFPVRDLVAWHALIAGHVHAEHDVVALKCLEQMQVEVSFQMVS
ncbi:hypothetical protein L7F22_032572 [Adiantum nelumboides]|nr:hypothetical protein [Adiantum nelumboides]